MNVMKARFPRRFTLAVTLLFSASIAFASGRSQVKDELFSGAEKFAANAKESTEVNLDSRLLALAGNAGGADKQELMKKLDFVIVRSYEYAKAGDYNFADVEEFTARLNTGGWMHIVKERSGKESTDVCVKSDGDGTVSELVVIAAEPKELTMIHLKGHLNLNDLMKAGASYGVPQGAIPLPKK